MGGAEMSDPKLHSKEHNAKHVTQAFVCAQLISLTDQTVNKSKTARDRQTNKAHTLVDQDYVSATGKRSKS